MASTIAQRYFTLLVGAKTGSLSG